MSEWKPIETAPKNGTTILVTDGKWVYAAAYHKDLIHWECPNCGQCEEQGEEYPWVLFDDGALNGWGETDATHWMSLPCPPKEVGNAT